MNTVKTGGVQMVPIDGRLQVWTKRIGAGPPTMLTLHGGPGSTHDTSNASRIFCRPTEFSSFTMISSDRATPISPIIQPFGWSSAFVKRWNRSERRSASWGSTYMAIPGAVCSQLNTR